MNFEKIKSDIEKFVSNRKWQDYHTPKNLTMALSVEASELMEIFSGKWKIKKNIQNQPLKNRSKMKLVMFFFI